MQDMGESKTERSPALLVLFRGPCSESNHTEANLVFGAALPHATSRHVRNTAAAISRTHLYAFLVDQCVDSKCRIRWANVWGLCALHCNSSLSSLSNTWRPASAYRTRTVTYGPRSFAVSGPTVWNTLSSTLRVSTTTLGQFQSGLKTILFRLAYGT